MISMKAAILAGTLVAGAAGITAYASGSFCTSETADTAQGTVTQTILTSGGDKSCCADEAGAQKTVAQNAVFKPTAQAATLSGSTCSATAEQTAQTASASCGAKATAKTASLASAGKSCSASEASAKKTMAQNALFTQKTQAATLSGDTCPATAKQTTAATAAASCEAATTVKTASLTSADKSCCAMDGTKKTSSKTTLAGVVPTATATN